MDATHMTAEEILRFYADPEEIERPGADPTILVNAEDLKAAMRDVRVTEDLLTKALDALSALTDPEGHIWHGSNGECTGECKDVRAVLVAAGPRIAPPRLLAKRQPCGCVVCTCGTEDRCLGCGAKQCGTHPVGAIPNPVYEVAALRSER